MHLTDVRAGHMSGGALVPRQRIDRRLCNHSGGPMVHTNNMRHLTAYRRSKSIIIDLLLKLKSFMKLCKPLRLVAQQPSHAPWLGIVE